MIVTFTIFPSIAVYFINYNWYLINNNKNNNNNSNNNDDNDNDDNNKNLMNVVIKNRHNKTNKY